MTKLRSSILFSCATFAFLVAFPAGALSPINKTIFGGVAIDGWDPVAYFLAGKPGEGGREH